MKNTQGKAYKSKCIIHLTITYFNFAFAFFTQKTRMLVLAQRLRLQNAGLALAEEVVLLLQEPLAF